MSINFIVIDLSRPRKMVMNKVDEVVFNYKMVDHKPLTTTQKVMIVTGAVIITSLLLPDVAVYAKDLISNLSDKEVVDLFKQHMEKLNYSDTLITKNLESFSPSTMRRILSECNEIKEAVGKSTPLVDFIELEYKGAKIVERGFEEGVKNLAHITRNINPFVKLFEAMR